MKHVQLGIGIACLCVLHGCSPTAPVAPEPVNARLPNNVAIYVNSEAAGDTVVVGRCVSSREYAAVRRGNWIDHWNLVRVEVIAIEKGHWTARLSEDANASLSLKFVARDSWPTPESGIMVDRAPWPYRSGLVYAFTLDTGQVPALIVRQEPRGATDLTPGTR